MPMSSQVVLGAVAVSAFLLNKGFSPLSFMQILLFGRIVAKYVEINNLGCFSSLEKVYPLGTHIS